MKIGIIGSGVVAQSLGAGFLKNGHEVTLGTSSPAKLADWQGKNPKAHVASFADAASFGELLVLTVKGHAAIAAVKAAGVKNFDGKTVIDTTNPIADKPPVDGVLQFFTSGSDSLLEQLQREFPSPKFVKAFNSVGSAFMVDPVFQLRPVHLAHQPNDEPRGNQIGRDLADEPPGMKAAEPEGKEGACGARNECGYHHVFRDE